MDDWTVGRDFLDARVRCLRRRQTRDLDGFELGGCAGRVRGGQKVQKVCRDGGGDGGPRPIPNRSVGEASRVAPEAR
jgi:hypothetical protein